MNTTHQLLRLIRLLVLAALICPAASPAPALASRLPAAAAKELPRTSATTAASQPAATTATQARLQASVDRLPLYFIENKGQTDDRVSFYVQGSDKTLFFAPDGVTFALTAPLTPTTPLAGLAPRPGLPSTNPLRRALPPTPTPQQGWAVKLDYVGANPAVRPVGENKSAATFSYFKGRPDQWQAGLGIYTQIRYPNLWPGIDLVYSGQVNELKYEFVVQPGADPGQIQLAYRGASDVQLTADGQLSVTTPLGGLRDAAPVAYQTKAGQRVPVAMRYALDPRNSAETPARSEYGFELGPYDPALPLVLDPAVLIYSGFIGGAALERGQAIAVDNAGNAYITGITQSGPTTFPVTGGPGLTKGNGDADAFVAKVNAAGTALIYAGYIGGTGDDWGNGIAVDGEGNAYVTGDTSSKPPTFPMAGGLDHTYNGGHSDAFVAKVNAAGTALLYAGYIGGASDDSAQGIAVDSAGNAYVTGYTTSDQATFPVAVGPDLTYNGAGNLLNGDAFVAKVNSAGTALLYAGYIGGVGDDGGAGIAVDGTGNAYVAGFTDSSESSFPVTGGPDLTYNGGAPPGDAFVAKVSPAGTNLVYAGYIGGASMDYATGIAVDGTGNAYVTGHTTSSQNSSFPVIVGPDLTYNDTGPVGYGDAFIAKVNPVGTALIYAGYIGGIFDDYGSAIAVDDTGAAYVTGNTASDQASFPVTVGPDLTFNGTTDYDAFVAKVNAAGTALVYAGYIGGSGRDFGNGIAVDGHGNAYITGDTESSQGAGGFPVIIGPDLTYNGGQDAFVAEVSAVEDGTNHTIAPTPIPSLAPPPEATAGLSSQLAPTTTPQPIGATSIAAIPTLVTSVPSRSQPGGAITSPLDYRFVWLGSGLICIGGILVALTGLLVVLRRKSP